jgi:hypothetical protein
MKRNRRKGNGDVERNEGQYCSVCRLCSCIVQRSTCSAGCSVLLNDTNLKSVSGMSKNFKRASGNGSSYFVICMKRIGCRSFVYHVRILFLHSDSEFRTTTKNLKAASRDTSQVPPTALPVAVPCLYI